MLVVLVIIGLIMGLVGPRVLNALTDARAKAAKLQIEALGSSLDLCDLDVGRYPSSSEGLTALVAAPGAVTGWNGRIGIVQHSDAARGPLMFPAGVVASRRDHVKSSHARQAL